MINKIKNNNKLKKIIIIIIIINLFNFFLIYRE